MHHASITHSKTAARIEDRKLIQVLIVDDHPVVREGLMLRISLEPDLRVCGDADDMAGALRVAEEIRPDVAVIDISLKSSHGVDLIKQLKTYHPSVRIAVWSMHSEDLYAERALRAGALAYVNKADPTDKLIEAIRSVFDRKYFVSPKISERLLGRGLGQAKPIVDDSLIGLLSDRELQVFQLLGEGFDLRQIATRLAVSPKTIETYCSRMKEKLHLATARELLAHAVQWMLKNY